MRALFVLVVSLAFVAGCGGGGDDTTTESVATSGDGCTSVDAPALRDPESLEAPTAALDASQTYTLTFETNCGKLTIALDQKGSPKTSASFVSLVEDGYFDDTIFHRIVPGFVIQGGDPTQTGSGGPGYTTVDPPPPSTTYTLGTVAMAKTQAEPAGSSGSQFFVVTTADAGLPAEYAAVGRVTNGLDTVDRIGGLGNALEQPTQTVLIEQATVTES